MHFFARTLGVLAWWLLLLETSRASLRLQDGCHKRSTHITAVVLHQPQRPLRLSLVELLLKQKGREVRE
jgi:hypothetical protein